MQTVVIRPRSWPDRAWAAELWHYRELMFFLTWRDIKVRYKQTSFGVLWALLQPLLFMVVYTVFLGRLAKVPSEGVPYAVFALSALVPWTMFAQSVTQASSSLVENQNLVSKVYTPRILLPAAAAASFLVDFLVSMMVLFALIVIIGPGLSAQVIWIIPFAILAWVTAVGVGIFFSAVNVRYRDVKYAVPFLIQIWMFVSPVVYPASLVPERYRNVYALNPMVGTIEGFRWALLGTDRAPMSTFVVSIAAAVCVLVLGVLYFVRVERSFADVI